ncbi:MAG TPA: hypothetical protein VJ919_06555 [Tangfeifania sp.]|nr:hypothetical protein [Tangfeifania sp.]
MQKLTAFSFILLVLTSFVNAQESSTTTFKIYYNFNKTVFNTTFDLESNNYSAIEYDLNTFSLGELSLALNIRNNARWAQEVELMPLSFHKTDFQQTQIERSIASAELSSETFNVWKSRLRYQLNYYLTDGNKIDFYLGLSSALNYQLFAKNPRNSYEFRNRLTKAGLVIGITPGIEFPISEKLNITVDGTYGILGLNLNRQNTNNPSLSMADRKQNNFSVDFGRQGYQLRVGLGYTD